MSEDAVVVERHGQVALVRINRPEVHNALDADTLNSLDDALRNSASDGGTRAIVITGTGPTAFSAGADLDQLRGLDATEAFDVLSVGQRVFSAIEHSPVPVVAAVNGLALGGGFELVLASAFAVLSTNASLGLPESGLGLIPGYGGTQRLARITGPAVAAHVMLTGTRLSADRAYALGLSPLAPVDPDDLVTTALEVVERIASRGPRANAAILRSLRSGAADRRDLALESALAALATSGAEATEGVAAFTERRTPMFADVPHRWSAS